MNPVKIKYNGVDYIISIRHFHNWKLDSNILANPYGRGETLSRYVTTATITKDDVSQGGTFQKYLEARCHPKDIPRRKEGRKVALRKSLEWIIENTP